MCCTYLAIQFWTCSNYIVSQSGLSGLTGFGGLLFVCTAWKAALQSGQWRLAAVLCSMCDRDWRQWIVADSEQHRRSVPRLAFLVFIGEPKWSSLSVDDLYSVRERAASCRKEHCLHFWFWGQMQGCIQISPLPACTVTKDVVPANTRFNTYWVVWTFTAWAQQWNERLVSDPVPLDLLECKDYTHDV